MESSPNGSMDQSDRFEIVPRFQAALPILLEAYDYARQLQRSIWDFVVEIHLLRAAGLTNSDLRWFVCRGLVEQATEITRAAQDSRVFHRTGSLTFTKRTCFVLTEAGAALARQRPNPATPLDGLPPLP